jgi:hypothetical protein
MASGDGSIIPMATGAKGGVMAVVEREGVPLKKA